MVRRLLVYLSHPHVDCWNFKARHRERLEQSFPGMKIVHCLHSREFLAGLPEADAAVVWFFKPEWWQQAPRLQLLSTPAAGMDWIQLPETPPKTEVWFGSFHGPMMAESVLGAALHFLKAFPLSTHMQRKKKWARVKISEQIGTLHNSRVTIYGFGRIGQAIGRTFKTFGAYITGIKRHPGPVPDYFGPQDRLATPDQIPGIFPETDHLILALPGGMETDGVLGLEALRLLPHHCILYNVGRGNSYREEDLLCAFRENHLRGAYLDVFATEPLPEDSPLWDLEQVLIQPHLSAASPQYLDLYTDELIARLKRWDGRKPGL